MTPPTELSKILRTGETLPAADSLAWRLVGGDRVTCTLADLSLRACVLIEAELEKTNPDNALIDCLCNTVRLVREVSGDFE